MLRNYIWRKFYWNFIIVCRFIFHFELLQCKLHNIYMFFWYHDCNLIKYSHVDFKWHDFYIFSKWSVYNCWNNNLSSCILWNHWQTLFEIFCNENDVNNVINELNWAELSWIKDQLSWIKNLIQLNLMIQKQDSI